MKISVITPAHDSEKYLPETLDSIMGQTMDRSDYEVIVIENGSSDHTAEILEQYSRKYPNLRFRSYGKLSPGLARNIGMNLAEGDFFYFLDADDLLPRDSLASLYDRAVSQNADLVVAGYEIFNGVSSRRVKKIEKLTRKDTIDPFDPDLLWTFSLCNKLFRASVVRKHGLRLPDLIYSEDGVFLMSYLAVCGKITGLDQSVFSYRKMGSALQSSITTSSVTAEKLKSYLTAHREIRRILKERLMKRYAEDDINAICRKHSDAAMCMREFSYKELYTLIDQFYLHFWAMDQETADLTRQAVSKRFDAIDQEGRIRTVQQWYDLDLTEVGKEDVLVREKPLITAVLFADRLNDSVRELAAQDMVTLRILLPESIKKDLQEEGLVHGNMFFADAHSEEELRKYAAAESGFLLLCSQDAAFPAGALRTALRSLQLAHAPKVVPYPVPASLLRGEKVGRVLSKAKREALIVLSKAKREAGRRLFLHQSRRDS